jgi:hypothetical protein
VIDGLVCTWIGCFKKLCSVTDAVAKNLERVVIRSDVKVIGEWCFSKCQSLREVAFEPGSNLRHIERNAFERTRIGSIQIPWRVEFIGGYCFEHCELLREVTFESGSSLKEIGDYAFYHTAVDLEIEIPEKCEKMTGVSLMGVKRISVHDRNPFFVIDEGFLKSSDRKSLVRCIRSKESIVIDKRFEQISVGCFAGCGSVQELIFEQRSSLRRPEEAAFQATAVKSIKIPSTVESIGDFCFSTCYVLCEVTFERGSNLRSIGRVAFSGTALKTIRIPSSVEFIGGYCFGLCLKLCEITFEGSVKLDGKSNFDNCPLKLVRVAKYEEIGNLDSNLPKGCQVQFIK